ncbi:unnamed protein product [Clonostachys rosea]|uniref:Heterokaryon incompatibility domain-containing protein n=1 Tax=Bionectria ochroleuca TaxID=29856 RepID=A0ABY6V078_BIOOC|nr:unnamed protein product [Clonostachys rosea]
MFCQPSSSRAAPAYIVEETVFPESVLPEIQQIKKNTESSRAMEKLRGIQTLRVFPHCRLCRFKFQEDEKVVVVTLDNKHSKPFLYAYHDSHIDKALKAEIVCTSSADEANGDHHIGTGCHLTCLRFANKLEPEDVVHQAQVSNHFRQFDHQLPLSGTTVIKAALKSDLSLVYSPKKHLMIDVSNKRQRFESRAKEAFLKAKFLFQPDKGKPMGRLFAASLYAYEPPASEESRRLLHVRSQLAMLFSKRSKSRVSLPLEIWKSIAGYLVSEFAICSMLSLPFRNSTEVSTANDLWATHVNIDGIDYMSKLTSKPSRGAKLALRAADMAFGNSLYILEDHLGIRKMIASAQPPTHKGEMSAWWRVVPLERGEKLSFTTDSLKLHYRSGRKKALGLGQSVSPDDCLWSKPISPQDIDELFFYQPLSQRATMHMVSIPINQPGCTGYSVCWIKTPSWKGERKKGTGLVYIHAHQPGESLSFYEDVARHTDNYIWQYAPTMEGERLMELELLYNRHKSPPRRLTLAFRTSKKRDLVFGPYAEKLNLEKTLTWNETWGWDLVSTFSEDAPDTLWMEYPRFEGGTSGFVIGPQHRGLSCSRYFDPFKALPPSLPCPLPDRRQDKELFQSSASLSDLSEIVVCRSRMAGQHSSICGLLLRYEDSSERSVGSFRVDWAERPISVPGKSPALFLNFIQDDLRCFINELAFFPQDTHGMLNTWKEFYWADELVWVYSWKDCYVYSI